MFLAQALAEETVPPLDEPLAPSQLPADNDVDLAQISSELQELLDWAETAAKFELNEVHVKIQRFCRPDMFDGMSGEDFMEVRESLKVLLVNSTLDALQEWGFDRLQSYGKHRIFDRHKLAGLSWHEAACNKEFGQWMVHFCPKQNVILHAWHARMIVLRGSSEASAVDAVPADANPTDSDVHMDLDTRSDVAAGRAASEAGAPADADSGVVRKTLEEMVAMSFYELYDIEPGASSAQVKKAFAKLALIYHPDKGGAPVTFRYINMVREVLLSPEKRKDYDERGKDQFTADYKQGMKSLEVPCPPFNVEFMRELAAMTSPNEFFWGSCSLAQALKMEADGLCRRKVDTYYESSLASDIGISLRLVGKGQSLPLYIKPRLIRFAGLMGMGLIELDFPASHGQQLFKYARLHGLPHSALASAFQDMDSIYAFRQRRDFIDAGLLPSDVKTATNLLCYGNALKEWLAKHHLIRLPGPLQLLKNEFKGALQHMVENAPADLVEYLKAHRPKWQLTLLSIYLQQGERRDLDACVAKLPKDATVHGWLGDSVLIAPSATFSADIFCSAMAALGIYITTKPLPATAAEYFDLYASITGQEFNQCLLSGRVLRRVEAREYAQRYINTMHLKKGRMSHIPHLEFAIAVEDRMPVVYNPQSGAAEFWSAQHGRWFEDGGKDQVKGELLSDALRETFTPTQWGYAADCDRPKLRRVPICDWDDSCMRSGTFMGPIGEMSRHLRFKCDETLDCGPNVAKLINFEGAYILDYSVPKIAVDWTDDQALDDALHLPLRHSVQADRTSRSVPHPFERYSSPARFDGARAILRAMEDLKTADVLSAEARFFRVDFITFISC